MILEQKEFNDVVLKVSVPIPFMCGARHELRDPVIVLSQVGLGWDDSLQDELIRSSSGIKDEINMPIDYAKLIERNAPDVKASHHQRML